MRLWCFCSLGGGRCGPSLRRGFYTEPFSVTIGTVTEGAAIYYATDGTEPSPSSGKIYTGPMRVDRAATLRAVAYGEDLLPSNAATQTYIFLEEVLQHTGEGFPHDWGDHPVDYAMDPEAVARYRATIEDDLKSIPRLSIVLPVEDIFGKERGLYPNAVWRGEAGERDSPCGTTMERGSGNFLLLKKERT